MDIKEVKALIYKKLSNLTKQKFDDKSDINKIGIDSLDLVELVTDAEDEFKVRISDEDLESIKTVGDVIRVFEAQIK